MIDIKKTSLCDSCANKTCSFVDARVRDDFYGMRTETTVCPTGVLTDGPDTESTKKISDDKDCIRCGLCVKSCSNNNLTIDYTNMSDSDFDNLSEQQLNAIACSYLNGILEYSANSNRNKALLFDGFAMTRNGIKMYVEVDGNNDSLESTRRILGHFMLYSNRNGLCTGLVVLRDLPKEGSRDVYDLIEKMSNFPTTIDLRIVFTTFSVLRKLFLQLNDKNQSFDTFFYNPLKETSDDYINRIEQLIQN